MIKNNLIKIYYEKYNEKSFVHFKFRVKFYKEYFEYVKILRQIWFSEHELVYLIYKYKLLEPDEGGIMEIINEKLNNKNIKPYVKIDEKKKNEIYNKKNILYYKLLNHKSIQLWELINKYNLIEKHYEHIYEIIPGINNTVSDCIILYYDKYYPTKNNLNYNSFNLEFFILNKEVKNTYKSLNVNNMSIFKNIKFLDITNINNFYENIEKIKEIDFIFLNFFSPTTSIGVVPIYNIMRMFELYTFLKIINKINIKGSICIFLSNIIGKKHLKLLSFYCYFFEEYYITYPEIYDAENDRCLFLILKNKKNIIFDTSKLLEKLHNNIPFLGINKKLFTEDFEDKQIKNSKPAIIPQEYYEIYDDKILNKIKINNKTIKKIFNNLKNDTKETLKFLYYNILKNLENVKNIYNNKINGLLMDNKINEIKIKNIEECKKWARKYNFSLIPEYNISHFDLSYSNIIYRDMFSYENDIYFKFKPYEKIFFDINFTTNEDFVNLPLSFEKMIGKSKEDKRAFEYRNINSYKNIKLNIDYYYKKLTYAISFLYDLPSEHVSNDEWLKIVEILCKLPIIDRTKTNLKTFHICEFSGSYVNAISFYLKLKTTKMLWFWKAQRLNPKLTTKYNDNVITNDFDNIYNDVRYDQNMLYNYHDNYDFGSDNSGDITKYENIQYYRKNHNDYDLITAGCGSVIDNNILSYSQYLMIFSCCKKGGNSIIKRVFPIENTQELTMLYLFYYLFENVIVYKPKLNYHSQEYYLIGLNYKGIKPQLLDKLINFLKDYKTIGFMINIPMNFMLQVDKMQNELIENMNKFIKKQIYFCDNYETITKEEWIIIKKTIKEKIKDWFLSINI